MNTSDFKQIFEQSSELLVVIDTNFAIVAASDAFLKTTATVRESIVGRNAFEMFPDNPDDKTANGERIVQASFNRVIKNKTKDVLPVVKYDIPKPESEGGGYELKYWQATSSPILDENNNVKYIIHRTEDVTENKILITQLEFDKKALKLLEDSEKRYNMMLMKSPFAFAVFKGRDMVITLANDSIKEMWGKGKDIEGKPLLEVLPEIKDSAFPDLIDKVYTTGAPFYGDELLASILRNGKQEDAYYNFVYQPYLEADETISGVTVIAYEVTAKVMVKKALAAQHDAEQKALELVEETNKRYYTMLMESPFAFSIMKGKEMVVSLANDLMKEFWGKGVDVEGKTLLQLLPELKDQPFPAMLDKVYTTGVPVYANEILARLQHKDKMQERYFNIVYQPDHDADGTISGVITIAYDVTEMILARKKIETSEARFKSIVMQTPVAIGIYKGKEYIAEIANEHCLQMLNKGVAFVGKPLFDILPELETQGFKGLMDNVMESGTTYYGNELAFNIHKNNISTQGFYNFIIQQLRADDESVTGIIVVASEVTEQVLARQKVEESELRFRNLIYSSPSAIGILLGEDLVITIANEPIIEIWGKGKEIIGKKYFEALPELAEQGYKEVFNQVYKTGIPFNAIETPVRILQNGATTLKYYNFILYPQKNINGEINGIGIIATEVTTQAKYNLQIKESEQRFRSLVEKSPYPICIFKGKEMKLEVANEPMLKIFNMGEEVLGKPFLEILPEMKEQPFMALLLDVLENGVSHYGSEQPAYFLRENGEKDILYFNFVYQPYRENDGSVSGVMSLATDVTEQVLARKKVEASEFRFHNMVYTSPSMIAIFKGEDMIIEIANDSIMESWGKGKDIIGKSLLSIMPEIIVQGFDKILSDVYKTGIPFHAYEAPVSLLRNGKLEVLYYTYVYQAQRNIKGEIEGVAVIASEVTPQATLNLKIRESEGRFRQLVQQAPVAICVIRGEKYVVETVNAGMLEFWGRTEAQVLHKPIFEVLTELEGQGFEALVNGVYTTGQKFVGTELPVTLLRKGQLENAYVTFVYEPLREVDGTISGIMVLAHEITDLVVARKKIEAQVTMHEDMLMNAPYVICTLEGPNHVYSFVNEQYQKLFGSRILTGKPFLKAIPEFEGQGFDTILDKIYNTGETYIGNEIPATFPREEGLESELRYFNFSYQPMFDENRKIYSILGFGYEVTEVVKAKLIIEESELQFRVLTNSMPQKITNADANGNVIFFNQQWLDDTGLTFEELKDWGWEKSIHPDDLKLTIKNWRHSVSTGEAFDMECRIRNKDGEYRWHLSRAVAVRDENGKIVTWVGSNTDIHEQKEQKEVLEKAVKSRTKELEIMNLELENANKDLTSFTYVSSHDLQEPLRKIQNFASMILLEEEENLSGTGKGYLQRMTQTAKRMQALIEDLLTYSRAKNGERIIETVDLNVLLNEVRVDFEELIHQKNATIEAHLCDARVIPFQFRQLMQNLISNSLKFSKPDLPPHIIIKGKIAKGKELRESCPPESQGKLIDQEKYCNIIFTDNGIGFEPEYKERIFGVFQRLHSVEEYAGTGIGLAICRKIIENHNGIITATGKLNEGARFEIYIPA